jgi:hypothetical protein
VEGCDVVKLDVSFKLCTPEMVRRAGSSSPSVTALLGIIKSCLIASPGTTILYRYKRIKEYSSSASPKVWLSSKTVSQGFIFLHFAKRLGDCIVSEK